MSGFGLWDVALVVAVSAMAAVTAYSQSPRVKAMMVTLPIPSTLACLSVGAPVNATHVGGLLLLLGYFFLLYFLHARMGANVILSILLAAGGYCLLGTGLARVMPRGGEAFWAVACLVFCVGLVLHLLLPRKTDPGHKTSLPFYVKLPAIIAVVVALVLMKKNLQGFMTVFPMVGVVASYESRKCLWSICKQMPLATLALLSLFAACRLTEPLVGFHGSLLCGWVVFLVELPFIVRWQRRNLRVAATGIILGN